MTTFRDLGTASLREIGVIAAGETPSADDLDLVLGSYNRWIDSQGLDRLAAFETTRTLFSITSGEGDYAFDVGLDYNISVSDGFDTTWSGVPPGWTSSITGGSIINYTASVQAGGHAVELVNNLGVAGDPTIYQDFTFKAGASAVFTVWGWCDVSAKGYMKVKCIESGHFLQSDGTWSETDLPVFIIGTGATTFVQHTKTVDLEDEDVADSSIVTLRISFLTANSICAFVFDTFSITTDVVGIAARRPVFLDHVNLVDTSQSPDAETPLTMFTDDGWAAVTQKAQTSTIPTHWYYNPTFPEGALTLWPTPTSSTLQGAVYIRTQVSTFDDLDTTVSLPPGYERMIVKNLALELCPAFEKTPSPLLIQQASQAMGAVKRVNRRLAELDVSGGFGRHRYSIWTDQ